MFFFIKLNISFNHNKNFVKNFYFKLFSEKDYKEVKL